MGKNGRVKVPILQYFIEELYGEDKFIIDEHIVLLFGLNKTLFTIHKLYKKKKHFIINYTQKYSREKNPEESL